jgi:hypothetical protein
MRFLVIGRGIDYGGPMDPADFVAAAEYIILPSIKMLKDWEDKKVIVGGLFAGQRAGVMIIESPSAEELSKTMNSLPFWTQNTWEVIPLQSLQSGVEDLKAQIARAKKMADMAQAANVSPMPTEKSTGDVMPQF